MDDMQKTIHSLLSTIKLVSDDSQDTKISLAALVNLLVINGLISKAELESEINSLKTRVANTQG